MAGRGRGRGRGGSSSFSREQLDTMGAESLPGPVTQPPPLFPPLESKPAPLVSTKDTNYMLILKQDFMEHMQYMSTSLDLPEEFKEPELEIDKLLAQLPKVQETCSFDWDMFPKELRSKSLPKPQKETRVEKDFDVNERLQKLEKLEEKGVGGKRIKTEAAEVEEEDEEMLDEEQDEEMDEGTDYVNNYFDNGEDYEDEDDNLDDGPVY